MAKSTVKSIPVGGRPISSIEPPKTVTFSMTVDQDQFKKLSIMKKKSGLLYEQDVVRLFIANGTKHIEL